MSRNKTIIKRLTRRKNWLDKRIEENPDKDMSFDKAESSALDYAIEKLVREEGEKEKPAIADGQF